MNPSSTSTNIPLSIGSLWAGVAGAIGGLLAYFVSELSNPITHVAEVDAATNLGQLIIGTSIWSAGIGLTIGAAILIYDNLASLRGQWHRDLLGGVPLFFGLSFVGGAAGQIFYAIAPNSLTRGVAWALMGACVGIGIGVLRRDLTQAGRGALGGSIGGFIGGFIFNGLLVISSANNGSLSRFVGLIIMGALVALMMKVVQDALKEAWLLGISTGPYEGKEYQLNTSRVTVGRDDSNAIALYRERELPASIGALVFQNGQWFWQGTHVSVNGVPQNNAPLNPGDTLLIGSTRFRFKTRSANNVVPYSGILAETPAAYAPNNYSSPPPIVANWDSAPTPTPQVPAPTVVSVPSFALMGFNGQLIRLPDLSSTVTVGRTAGNQVVLSDAGVSSSHARLQILNGSLKVIDLHSTNGTFINGAKISPDQPYPLRVGDRIRFGALEYTLRNS